MNKAWSIAYKDTLIRFRDRNGILLMLAAPLVLALIIGAAFGGLSGGGSGSSPITDIPVILVNADEGDLGQSVADIFFSEDLAELLEPAEFDDLAGAKQEVERGNVRAVVYIPADFSDTVQSQTGAATAIAVFTDPAATVSPIIIRSIVSQIINGYNADIVGGRVGVMQLLENQNQAGANLADLPQVVAETLSANAGAGGYEINLKTSVIGGDAGESINPMAYFAVSMAILFLMFTIFDASRSILREEQDWTLQRMMSTPTSFAHILSGKIGGVFLTGVLQLSILILASTLLFRLSWGNSLLGLALMVVAVVAAAASLGAFITAFSRDAIQANIIGSAVALIFAILGGNFFISSAYPDWLQPLSKLTINRWALDGFNELSLYGGGLQDVLLEVAVLLGMAAILFALALWRLPKRFVK